MKILGYKRKIEGRKITIEAIFDESIEELLSKEVRVEGRHPIDNAFLEIAKLIRVNCR